MNLIKAGIVFSNPLPALSEILQFVLRNPWSHSAIATGNGTEVIGAEGGGVIKRELSERELKKFAVLELPEMTEDEKEKIVRWALEKWEKKTKYDFKQLLVGFPFLIDAHENGKVTCSNFVYLCYLSVGRVLVRRENPVLIAPSHLWYQSNLRRSYEVGRNSYSTCLSVRV